MNKRTPNEQPVNRFAYGLWFWVITILAVLFFLGMLAHTQW
jgi:hypothetical protein